MIDPKTVILIAGPTASGKTGLSTDLAKQINGAIVNADSMQVYTELPILSAQPSTKERANIDHYLFGHMPINQHYSVAQWRQEALTAIENIRQKGQIPILVGGTGLYFKAMIEGLSPIPEISLETRKKVSALYDQIGAEAFHAYLKEVDPDMAERLPATDRQRCIRAIEIYQETKKTLSDWQTLPRVKAPDDFIFKAFILKPEREMLYQHINQRFDHMMDNGALEEAKAIHRLDLDPLLPSLKAVGLPPLRAYLDKELSLEEAIEQAKTHSRRYAKRQFTWFNNQMPETDEKSLSIWHLQSPYDVKTCLSYLSS